MEGVSSKDTFHVTKTAVDLSIFSQLPFFKNYFLKLLQKLKKPTHLALIRLAKKKKRVRKEDKLHGLERLVITTWQ